MEAAKPTPVQAPEALKPRRCTFCNGWLLAPQDSYCGFCGRLQAGVSLAVPGGSLTLIEKIGKPQHFALHNQRSQPVLVTVAAKGALIPGVSVDPKEHLLPPNGVQSFQLRLEGSKLPEGFTTGEQVLSCRLDKDPKKSLDVRVTVKAGPRVMVQPSSLNFGQIAQGEQAKRELTLVNRGGLPLRLTAIEVQGSQQLRPGSGSKVPVEIPVGGKLALEVLWNTELGEPEESLRGAGLRFQFGEQIDPVTVSVLGRPFRRNLSLKPEAIEEPRVLPGYHLDRDVTLENKGTVDLEVGKLHCEAPWVTILEPKGRFTLEAPDLDASQVKNTSIVTVKLRLSPQKLQPGHHETVLQILGTGSEVLEKLPIRLVVLKTRRYDGFVGIDFGTTNSVVTLLDPFAGLKMVRDLSVKGEESEGSFLIPSLVVFEGEGDTYHIGRKAVQVSDGNPRGTLRSIKKLLGRKAPERLLGQTRLHPEEVVARILHRLKEYTERTLIDLRGEGFLVDEAVFTVPAAFYDAQIQALLRACEQVGLRGQARKAGERALTGHGDILYEPSAAAYAFLQHLQDRPGTEGDELEKQLAAKKELHFLVYDHGGGTLDISIAKLVEDETQTKRWKLEIKSNLGDSTVGGDNFDLVLMTELLTEFKNGASLDAFNMPLYTAPFGELEERARREGWMGDLPTVLRARAAWNNLAQGAKERLSENESDEVTVDPLSVLVPKRNGGTGWEQADLPGKTVLTVTRTQLEERTSQLLDRCEHLAKRALAVAKLTPSKVDYLLHTGRQSLMPAVQDLLTKPRRPNKAPEEAPAPPLLNGETLQVLWERHLIKVCVSQGAARTAEQQAAAGEGGIMLSNSGRVLPVSYGIPMRGRGAKLEFREILSQGATYPISAEHLVPPGEINANGKYRLRIFQSTGESKRLERKLGALLLADVEVDTLKDETPGCQLQFEVDENRRLTVLADSLPVVIEPEEMEDEDNWWW